MISVREAFVTLGRWIDKNDPNLQQLINEACAANPWFTYDNVELALKSIGRQYLDDARLNAWIESYTRRQHLPRVVGLILAGNVPMVGFHDILSVLVSGHHAMVKLSDRDDVLIPGLVSKMEEWYPDMVNLISFVDRLKGFDAIIATGSNQSATYFQKYFNKYPHIIRKNRNAVGILTGLEKPEALQRLGQDIFLHFGLGCRNVSKIFVPRGYDFAAFLNVMNSYRQVIEHSKYRNNYDYHLATALISRQNYMSNDCLILLEAQAITSKISVLHYEYYDQMSELIKKLENDREQIQCILSQEPLGDIATIRFGEAQRPTLTDYADGVDTMQFLQAL